MPAFRALLGHCPGDRTVIWATAGCQSKQVLATLLCTRRPAGGEIEVTVSLLSFKKRSWKGADWPRDSPDTKQRRQSSTSAIRPLGTLGIRELAGENCLEVPRQHQPAAVYQFSSPNTSPRIPITGHSRTTETLQRASYRAQEVSRPKPTVKGTPHNSNLLSAAYLGCPIRVFLSFCRPEPPALLLPRR